MPFEGQGLRRVLLRALFGWGDNEWSAEVMTTTPTDAINCLEKLLRQAVPPASSNGELAAKCLEVLREDQRNRPEKEIEAIG